MTYTFGDLKNNFEYLTIKKNGIDTYNLYGLMWWEYVQDGKKTKSLVNVKSNNLKWNYKTTIEQNFDYTYFKSGTGSIVGDWLSSMTRQILYNFSFYNIMSDDVLVTLTILNEGKDGLMKYNIYEGIDSYIVKINVAGVNREDIRVIQEDGVIRVRTNPMVVDIEGADVRLEMFEPIKGDTEISLPNIESVEAKLEDGILILTAPKQVKGVKINIK